MENNKENCKIIINGEEEKKLSSFYEYKYFENSFDKDNNQGEDIILENSFD